MVSILKSDGDLGQNLYQNLYKKWGVTGLESNLAKLLNRDIH